MKHLVLSVLFITIFTNASQAQLNNYKYIIVPKRFEGFKKENQHLTSTLVKHLFTQQGFSTAYEDVLPPELNENRCLGLHVKLDDASSMFLTKLRLLLVDCQGKEVFATQEGKSKEKDYVLAYKGAIMEAFHSIEALGYNYSGRGIKQAPITVSFKNDVKELKAPDDAGKSQEKLDKKIKVQQEATQEQQSYNSVEPVESDYTKGAAKDQKIVQPSSETEQPAMATTPVEILEQGPQDGDGMPFLYAQEIANGFQLVDSTPKIVLKMFATSVPDVYTATNDKGTGVVYKKNGKWFFEYLIGETVEIEELHIKF